MRRKIDIESYIYLGLEARYHKEQIVCWTTKLEAAQSIGANRDLLARIEGVIEDDRRKMQRALDNRLAIRACINNVEDERYRTLLRYRYIEGLTFEDLAEKMGYSYRHVMNLHKKALEVVGWDASKES